MRTTTAFALLFTFLVALFLSGCGGSSGSAGSDINPVVTIDWPTRSRGIDGPSSALSARIVLVDVFGNQPDNTALELRSVNPAAHSESYTLPAKSKLGSYTLLLSFHSGTAEASQEVGVVNVPVKLTANGFVNPDGSPLGQIGFDAVIKTLTIYPGQIVGVGEIQQLTATPRDAQSNPIVVSPGSISYFLRSGSDSMSISAEGVATGIAVGTGVVYATVDKVQSPDASVSVLQQVRSIVNVASNGLAFDPVSGLIWSTVGNTGTHANSIVGIDPATGLVTKAYPLGVEPNLIAVTDDGQFAYVTVPSDKTTRRVDLATGTVGLSFVAGDIVSMCTVPGSPHTVLVGGSPIGGVNVSVFDDGVRRANTGAGGYFIHMASPTTMYGNGDASLFTCVLVPGAINWTGQNMNLITNDFVVHNGLLIDADGHVVNPATMTSVRQLSTEHFLSDGRHMASSDSDNRAYIVTWNSSVNKQILSYDLTSYAELPPRDSGFIPGGATDIVACGNHTVAFRDYGAIISPNQIFIIRGLL
jgi:hypothetical protein